MAIMMRRTTRTDVRRTGRAGAGSAEEPRLLLARTAVRTAGTDGGATAARAAHRRLASSTMGSRLDGLLLAALHHGLGSNQADPSQRYILFHFNYECQWRRIGSVQVDETNFSGFQGD